MIPRIMSDFIGSIKYSDGDHAAYRSKLKQGESLLKKNFFPEINERVCINLMREMIEGIEREKFDNRKGVIKFSQ